jgi:hypothetical protein
VKKSTIHTEFSALHRCQVGIVWACGCHPRCYRKWASDLCIPVSWCSCVYLCLYAGTDSALWSACGFIVFGERFHCAPCCCCIIVVAARTRRERRDREIPSMDYSISCLVARVVHQTCTDRKLCTQHTHSRSTTLHLVLLCFVIATVHSPTLCTSPLPFGVLVA